MTCKLAFTGLLLPLVSALSFPGALRGPGFVSVPVAAQARDHVLQRRGTDKTDDIEMPTFGGNSGWVVNGTSKTSAVITDADVCSSIHWQSRTDDLSITRYRIDRAMG